MQTFIRLLEGCAIDVFPAYDQAPAPTADDYLTDPDYPVDLAGEVQGTTCRVEAEGVA